MSDKPREWPNHRKDERDNTAIEITSALRALRRLMDGKPLTIEERTRLLLTAVISCERALRYMAQAGAPVRDI